MKVTRFRGRYDFVNRRDIVAFFRLREPARFLRSRLLLDTTTVATEFHKGIWCHAELSSVIYLDVCREDNDNDDDDDNEVDFHR